MGCEFGQMFRRFGSEVTILQAGGRLLPAEDEEIGEAVRKRRADSRPHRRPGDRRPRRGVFENRVHGRDPATEGRQHVHAVFSDPPVARVGLNEREARERGVEHRVASTPMTRVARAIEMGETDGLMKVLVDPASRRILGASMIGVSADEVIHIFAAVSGEPVVGVR